MAAFESGKVTSILERDPQLCRVRLDVAGDELDAVGYPPMLGPVEVGDRVVVNTTGIELGLGTGGEGFLLWNLDRGGPGERGRGHIVKLRYTPWQTNVLAVEEPDSPHHGVMAEADSIGGAPVVACGLHSQLAGVVAGIKAVAPGARVGHLMTDGGALPHPWSRLARRLRDEGLLEVTCTVGHAFGGDIEAVNVFSGLAALRSVGRADVIVVAMGPGVVGTATKLGFSAIEQGQVLDAAAALGGRSVACLRISFHDDRDRHRGISHHSLTALSLAARERSTVVVPALEPEDASMVAAQLEASGIAERHEVVMQDGAPGVALLRDAGIEPSSMGMSMRERPEPFLAASAAGAYAAGLLR